MQLARVIGTVVATVKNPSLEGRKLLIVQSLNKDLLPQGKPLVAVDAAGAGVGELVFWCRGKEASFLAGGEFPIPVASNHQRPHDPDSFGADPFPDSPG
jgi:microcompartment protein CcmK/EutM